MESIEQRLNGLPHKDYAEGCRIFDEALSLCGDVRLAVGTVYRMGFLAGKQLIVERNQARYLERVARRAANSPDSPPKANEEGSNTDE